MNTAVPITGVTSDSRQVKPGYAFVAIKGSQADGDDYVYDAVARGAAIIYSEQSHPNLPVPVMTVRNSRKTLASLAAAFYDHPSGKMKLIGVTGTNGKTTTAEIIFRLLQEEGINTGLIGTLGAWAGNRCYPPALTTPEPVELQQRLAEMVAAGAEAAVMEVSSHGIRQNRIWATDFDCGVFTNISRDHMDLHSSFDDYLDTKLNFIRAIPPGKLVLYNADDEYADKVAREIKGIPFPFGLQEGDLRAEEVGTDIAGTGFVFHLHRPLPAVKGGRIAPIAFPVRTPVLGIHNVYNLLAAAAAALHYGVAPVTIQQALKTDSGVWRRQQVIQTAPFTVIDDCTHNPGNYRSLFDTLSLLEFERLLLVAATRGNRGKEINMENGRAICQGVFPFLSRARIWITDCTDTAKPADWVAPSEREALLGELRRAQIPFIFTERLSDALENALTEAGPGDLVVLAGAHPMDRASSLVDQILTTATAKAGGINI